MKSNVRTVIEKRLIKALAKTMRDAPKVLGLEGQRHFQENFNSQSLEGRKWKEVKRREVGTFEYKYPKRKYLARRTNPILIGRTRRLKNALNRTFRSGLSNKLIWRVDLPYAKAQNNGNKRLTARTFMKLTPKLISRLKLKFNQMLTRNLK